MKKIILPILCLSVIFSNQTVWAMSMGSMDAGAINTQYMKEIKGFEAKSRMQERDAIVKSTKDEGNVPAAVGNLTKIQFVGNNNFSSEQLSAIIEDKMNKPMNAENLSELRKRLMRFYQSEGFYSAVPVIISQDNKTGELVIEIKEGSKNSITVQ